MPIKISVIIIFRNLYLYKFLGVTRHVCVCDLVDIYGMEHLSINIYNPATQRFLSLPSTSVLECPIHNNLSTIGVSFLPTINGYKVFQFFFRVRQPHKCMVYSSIIGSWKSIGCVAHGLFANNKNVCINGTMYWLCRSILDGMLVAHILAVDWEANFSIIRIPEDSKESIWVKKFSDYTSFSTRDDMKFFG